MTFQLELIFQGRYWETLVWTIPGDLQQNSDPLQPATHERPQECDAVQKICQIYHNAYRGHRLLPLAFSNTYPHYVVICT